MAKPNPSICIICINYENIRESTRFIDQLSAGHAEGIQVLMIDNSEVNPISNGDIGNSNIVKVVSAGGNQGYFGGFRVGLNYIRESNLQFDWIVLANPDISFGHQFFDILSSKKKDLDKILAPQIVSGISRRDQNPFMVSRPRSSRMLFYKMLFQSPLLFGIYDFFSNLKKLALRLIGRRRNHLDKKGHRQIYAPHGSLILFGKEALERLEGFSDAPFLFCEEVYLAEKCQRANTSVVYDPDLVAYHTESTTMSLIPSRRLSAYKAHANALVYDRYFSPSCSED